MSITTIIGPMFSGKTSELIRLIDRKRIAEKKCLIIKHLADNRFDKETTDKKHITTHSEIRYGKCDIMYLEDLLDNNVADTISTLYSVIGIEEGFFFKGLAKFCNRLANIGKDIYVSTLDSSYKQEPFSEVSDLIALSDNVIKLKAICMNCKQNEAAFTIRTTADEQLFLVGNDDIYQSVCRQCLISSNIA